MKGWAGDCSSAEANSNPQAKDSTASNDGATSSAHAEAHSAAHAAHSAAHAAHSAAQAAATNDFAAMNNAFSGMTMTGSEDYLKNVGNFVAAALDPLGIDSRLTLRLQMVSNPPKHLARQEILRSSRKRLQRILVRKRMRSRNHPLRSKLRSCRMTRNLKFPRI